jgi:anthranilate phosphoribosyltransferase
VARQVFEGQRSPVRDAVVVNAGIALALTEPDAGRDEGDFVAGVRRGMDRAEEALDSGEALRRLEAWAQASQRDDL